MIMIGQYFAEGYLQAILITGQYLGDGDLLVLFLKKKRGGGERR